jgi:hypothetical protein
MKEDLVSKSGSLDQGYWEKKYCRDETVVTRDIVGETILVPVRGKLADMQRIFTLNDVGAYIWANLDGEQSLAQICDGLQMDFDVQREQAERDLSDFISELLEAELIVGMV